MTERAPGEAPLLPDPREGDDLPIRPPEVSMPWVRRVMYWLYVVIVAMVIFGMVFGLVWQIVESGSGWRLPSF